MTSEQQARERIDELLEPAGWVVSNPPGANIYAARGVAIREFPLKSGHGFADYCCTSMAQRPGSSRRRKRASP